MKGLFIKDWGLISRTSYTALAFYALALVTVLPTALWELPPLSLSLNQNLGFFPVIFGGDSIETNPVVWGRLQLEIIVLGILGRILKQDNKTKLIRRAVVCLIIMASCAFASKAFAQCDWDNASFENEMTITVDTIARWEGSKKVGEFHIGYLDTIAEPDLPTSCYGHTKTAVVGKLYTEEFCRVLLKEEALEYRHGVREAMTKETKLVRITDERGAAFTSFCYNVGVRGCSRSTALKRLNKGNINGACDAMGWWNKSGGRIVRGIVNRRNHETRLCKKGL